MFDKSKKLNEIRPANLKPKEKIGIVKNKNAEMPKRDQKENKKNKSDMISEGGKN